MHNISHQFKDLEHSLPARSTGIYEHTGMVCEHGTGRKRVMIIALIQTAQPQTMYTTHFDVEVKWSFCPEDILIQAALK